MNSYSERYDAALALAASAHAGQTRKGSMIPYIIHPVHVSVILIRYGFSEDVAIAGLLHDVVEDQDYPLSDIKARFGQAVAEMVAAATERKKEAGQSRRWEDRKQESLDHIRQASTDAVAVKAADVLCNTRAMASALRQEGASVWRHFSRGPEQSMWYYRSLADLAHERMAGHPLIAELDEAVQDLEQAISETQGR
ncbi:MAG: HD domain-containing protein [Anaerolineae bacterium]|nr:HD domain-containing protein [Anaerolineae bacterium]